MFFLKLWALQYLCQISRISSFSCYVHLPFSVFLLKLSQSLEFLEGKESLKVPTCLVVYKDLL